MSQPDPDNIGDYLISARAFEEYRAMFNLSDEDVRSSILDCPGGGSNFTSRVRALGGRAVAADPVYAMDPSALADHVVTETDRGSAHTAAGRDRYLWGFYGDVEGHRRMRVESARAFAADLVAHPKRYVAASLPQLPFDDGQFDLVLSSHFLFTYADRLDAAFHLAALLELHRVSAGQVRVFPLLDQGGHGLDELIDELLSQLSTREVPARLEQAPYEFQRGGNTMLVLGGPHRS